MKKYMLSSLAVLSLVLGAAAAGYAQVAVKATVPFEFAVSGKVLPDGVYVLRRDMFKSVKIESPDGSATAVALAQYTECSTPKEEAVLVFDQIGNHYFLRQIWENGNAAGVEIPRSKMERELMKRSLASVWPQGQQPAGPELVYVVGQVQ